MRQKQAGRWLPMPLQSLLLFVVWLLLNNSFSVGHIVLGLVLALLIPWLVKPLQSVRAEISSGWLLLSYILRVLADIVVANFEVAWRVIRPSRYLRPAMIAIPLDLKTRLAITVLTNTISLTPGTVSAEISEDHCWLFVHVLDLENEAELVQQIKQRYEAPLKEIFEC